MSWRSVVAWFTSLFAPEQAHPPETLGAEAKDIVALSAQSLEATKRLAVAHAQYQEAQRQRLNVLEERVGFFERQERTTHMQAQRRPPRSGVGKESP